MLMIYYFSNIMAHTAWTLCLMQHSKLSVFGLSPTKTLLLTCPMICERSDGTHTYQVGVDNVTFLQSPLLRGQSTGPLYSACESVRHSFPLASIYSPRYVLARQPTDRALAPTTTTIECLGPLQTSFNICETPPGHFYKFCRLLPPLCESDSAVSVQLCELKWTIFELALPEGKDFWRAAIH